MDDARSAKFTVMYNKVSNALCGPSVMALTLFGVKRFT